MMLSVEPVLKENPNGILATKNGAMLATRMFQFLFSDENKAYFCTSSQKPVYEQLKKDANVSFCTYAPKFDPVVSLNGKVHFVDDIALKDRALEENPGIKRIYKSSANEIFKLFYIAVETVNTFSFSEGPKTIHV